MKIVVSNENLRLKMAEAVNLLCDTVKITLGPKGNNVIIDHSNFNPFITNDGVTIAENIASDDPIVNTILELAKEASFKMNDKIGDGTTTTLVLLQSIFNEGMNLIKQGINPITLKGELDKSLDLIRENLRNMSRKPTKEELVNIAITSANDKDIGSIISQAYFKVKSKSAIKIVECDSEETFVKYYKGYTFESNAASPYFFNNCEEIDYKDSYILLVNSFIDDIESVSEILNMIVEENKSIIIVANDYSIEFINYILNLYLNEKVKICLLKTPEYGINSLKILNDIKAISNAKVVDKLINIDISYLGKVNNIKVNKNVVVITFDNNESCKKKVMEIKKELALSNNDIDREFNEKRLAMFNKGLAEINVGARTLVERREKRMRFDDALCAIDSASKGILPGGGLIYLKVCKKMKAQSNGDKILKESLRKPFEQILINAGLLPKEIEENIIQNDYSLVYNVNEEKYENIDNTFVLDSTEGIINALVSACSIAGMLLTTNCLVINECTKEVNNYNIEL